MSATSRAVRTLLVPVSVLAVVTAASCGIRTDERPRALPVTTTSTLPSSTPPPAGPLETVLWYVEDQDLVPATRAVADRQLTTQVSALLDPGVRLEGGLSSSIPLGTELLGVDRVGDRITIDLSGAFDELAGTARQLALGQLVLTVTQNGSTGTIRFRVDGEPVRASTPERGDVDEVTVCDFVSLLPSIDQSTDQQLAPSTLEQLTARRAQVTAQCS